jgi:DNA-binding LacI/PurR family transcriptional regulator
MIQTRKQGLCIPLVISWSRLKEPNWNVYPFTTVQVTEFTFERAEKEILHLLSTPLSPTGCLFCFDCMTAKLVAQGCQQAI